MGWLLADLSDREQACRGEFADRFRAFAAKANQKRYERLFSKRTGKASKKRGR